MAEGSWEFEIESKRGKKNMAIVDVEWRNSAQTPSVCFFFASTPIIRLPPLPVLHQLLWWRRKSQACIWEKLRHCNTSYGTTVYAIRNCKFFSPPSMISPYRLLLIISVTFPLTLQHMEQHLYTTVYQTAPHKTKEEEAQQEGGLSIFSSAVSEVWLQRAATAVGGSYLRIWFHIWVSQEWTLACARLTG